MKKNLLWFNTKIQTVNKPINLLLVLRNQVNISNHTSKIEIQIYLSSILLQINFVNQFFLYLYNIFKLYIQRNLYKFYLKYSFDSFICKSTIFNTLVLFKNSFVKFLSSFLNGLKCLNIVYLCTIRFNSKLLVL